jgi:hypothetical protein
MKITVLTWNDKMLNAFVGKQEELDSFIEWKIAKGYELIKREEMTVAEYDSMRGIQTS